MSETATKRRRGRPSATVPSVAVKVDIEVYDLCCRIAIARQVPIRVVVREAVLRYTARPADRS